MTTEDPRQCWRTPAWLLDALMGGGWAGPWDWDAYADEDGSNAITMRESGRWGTRRRDWCHRRFSAWDLRRRHCSDTEMTGRHVFCNPPFRLWSRCVSDAFYHMSSEYPPASVTLVGLDDRSTGAGRALAEAEAACSPGDVHATRVPIVGRWGFDPPPGITRSTATRAHGVWVLRRVISPPKKEIDR